MHGSLVPAHGEAPHLRPGHQLPHRGARRGATEDRALPAPRRADAEALRGRPRGRLAHPGAALHQGREGVSVSRATARSRPRGGLNADTVAKKNIMSFDLLFL